MVTPPFERCSPPGPHLQVFCLPSVSPRHSGSCSAGTRGGGAQKRSTRSASAIALQATRCFSVSETRTAANLACQPSILLLTLAHWPLSLTQSEMNSVHPPAHTHHREEQLLLETDRRAACPAGHLTLAAAEAVCTYSGHHLLQSNLDVTFALLSSFPPPEPQENPGISTAKHQLHCPNPAKIGAVLRVIPSGTLLTPDGTLPPPPALYSAV